MVPEAMKESFAMPLTSSEGKESFAMPLTSSEGKDDNPIVIYSGKVAGNSFFEESRVTEEMLETLKNRFNRYCVFDRADENSRPYLALSDFERMNEHYAFCRPGEVPHFFRAIDRTAQGKIHFQDFLLGCVAAAPSTLHILNSFTGHVRARYIFDFYNRSCSGTLAYEELAELVADATKLNECPTEEQKRRAKAILEAAQDLGDISVATLRVNGIAGHICDLRVSTRWTGLRVRREIERIEGIPLEHQMMLIGGRPIPDHECVDQVLVDGATSADVTLVRSMNTGTSMTRAGPLSAHDSDNLGVERLVHVTFEKFHEALQREAFRGTSKLFRFQRCLLRKKGTRSGQQSGAIGGA